jgi:hypothetical protein
MMMFPLMSAMAGPRQIIHPDESASLAQELMRPDSPDWEKDGVPLEELQALVTGGKPLPCKLPLIPATAAILTITQGPIHEVVVAAAKHQLCWELVIKFSQAIYRTPREHSGKAGLHSFWDWLIR